VILIALAGSKLAGGTPKNERVENDYYATDPVAVKKLLTAYSGIDGLILEPCVGQGHIANTIKEFYTNPKEIVALDIVDRGYPNTIVTDFLTWEPSQKFDSIITNPPYSLAKEFVEKGMTLLNDDGVMAMFLKIQFLEGSKRKEMFKRYPPKYIYVFRNRMATWNNGEPKDPNGKRWATTMCHAWFVWENGSTSEPIVRWL
jgi:hypothetical protein